jgi:hypothetical protein
MRASVVHSTEELHVSVLPLSQSESSSYPVLFLHSMRDSVIQHGGASWRYPSANQNPPLILSYSSIQWGILSSSMEELHVGTLPLSQSEYSSYLVLFLHPIGLLSFTAPRSFMGVLYPSSSSSSLSSVIPSSTEGFCLSGMDALHVSTYPPIRMLLLCAVILYSNESFWPSQHRGASYEYLCTNQHPRHIQYQSSLSTGSFLFLSFTAQSRFMCSLLRQSQSSSFALVFFYPMRSSFFPNKRSFTVKIHLILLIMRQLQEYSRHHLFIHLLQGHDLPAKEWSNYQQNISHFQKFQNNNPWNAQNYYIIIKLPLY